MTVCNPSLATKPIPTCVGNLTIGTISDFNTMVSIIIEDITTGRREVYNSVSDGAGLVVANVESSEFSESHSYQGWVYKTVNGIGNPYTITIDASTTEYFALNFEQVFQDGVLMAQTDVTLEVA